MAENVPDKIISNTLFNTAGYLWKILVGLAITPYIISKIGIDGYGVWAIVGIISGYFGILDFGVGASFVKYISEFYARKEYTRINQLINTGIVFYLVFTLLIAVLAYFSLDTIIRILNIPPKLYSEAFFVFMFGVVLFGMSSIFSVFGAIQNGLQRMDLVNKISVLISIPMVIGTVYFLENGYGLKGLIVNNAIVLLITVAINIIVSYRLLPQIRLNPLLFNKEMFLKIFHFGYKVQVGNAGDMVVFQADKLLISAYLGLGMVGFYQVGSQIAQTMRSVPTLLISAILPAASEMNANDDHVTMRELYARGTKYLMLIAFPITLFMIVSASVIMLIWIGPGYESSALVIQVLAIGYLFNVLGGVAVSIGTAIEKPEYQMNAAIVAIVLNIVLGVVLISMMGLVGMAIAVTISLVVGTIYYFYKFHGEMSLPLYGFLIDLALIPFIASAIASALVYAFYAFARWAFPGTGRIYNLTIFIVAGVIFVAIYGALVWKNKCLDDYDIGLVKRYSSLGKMLTMLKLTK